MQLLRKYEDDPHLHKSTPPELADHPLFSGKHSVGLMTADAPRYKPEDPTGNEGLKSDLTQLGLPHEMTHGSYGGPENSYVIYNPTREQMFRLGKKYGQEAVVFSHHGKHEMLYTRGPNAGRAHHSLPVLRFSQDKPEDYYTHLPNRGYVTLHFGDEIHDTPLKWTLPKEHEVPANDQPLTKRELALAIKATVALTLKKAMIGAPPGPKPHPHAYEWHEGHTSYHHHAPANGVVIPRSKQTELMSLAKSDPAKMPEPPKPAGDEALNHKTNDQSIGAGASTYAKFAQPYGSVNKGQPSDLKHYPMEGTGPKVNDLVKKHGYTVYYAGGQHGKADLAGKNYNTGHLMIWDPSAGSGSDFGHADYTDNWRKIHELSHALTYQQLNQKYGEGRRMGGLGKQRSTNEAKRAVEWEWLAAHKQRELAAGLGIHIPDEQFHRELNTVMHDAVHRAVTGKFTEPSDEGFVPHPHKVPLETALGMVDEASGQMGLKGPHDVLKKFAQDLLEVLRSALKVRAE